MSIPRNLSIIADTLNADGTFASITDTGNLTFTGTGNRITGDFSNATASNRVIFQTSTASANTRIGIMPNAASTGTAGPVLYSTNDPNNASVFDIRITDGVQASLQSTFNGTGTYLPMTFYTGGSEAVRISSTAGSLGSVGIGYSSSLAGIGNNGLAVLGNVAIGNNAPIAPLHVAASTTLAAGQPSILLQGSSNTERIVTRSTSAPVFATQFANGTLASPTAVTSGNFLGGYQFGGYAATAFNRGAQISGYADGTWTDTSTPGYIAFTTVTASSTTLTERLRIDSSGNTVVTNVAGLGYGTGSGGTVTQATSKSTAVTLNKPTGRITMNNAALLPATSVNFTLNNSVFGDADVCIVNPLSSDSYTVTVYQSYSGVINIRVTNYSAGSLSDALQIKFAIIKGSIS